MFYIGLAIVLYALALVAGAYAARHSDITLASLIINVSSVIAPALVLLSIVSRNKVLPTSKYGWIAAIIGGLSVGLFVIIMNKSLSVNRVGIVTPLVFGGVIILSTLLSLLVFKEKVTYLQGVGLGVIVLGFGIVAYAKAIQS